MHTSRHTPHADLAAKRLREQHADTIREALAELLIRIDPESANKLALTLLRMAAALVAIHGEHAKGGPRSAAIELLAILTEGLPPFPAAMTGAAGSHAA